MSRKAIPRLSERRHMTSPREGFLKLLFLTNSKYICVDNQNIASSLLHGTAYCNAEQFIVTQDGFNQHSQRFSGQRQSGSCYEQIPAFKLTIYGLRSPVQSLILVGMLNIVGRQQLHKYRKTNHQSARCFSNLGTSSTLQHKKMYSY